MSYGRNFEMRVSPQIANRSARNYADAEFLIGAPVLTAAAATPEVDASGRSKAELATGATATPRPGEGGVAVFEDHGIAGVPGFDPWLTTASDLNFVPAGASVQVVNGGYVKFVLRNTPGFSLGGRAYEAQNMIDPAVAGSIAVGDTLTPGTGDNADGYWTTTATASEAWLVVTNVEAYGIHGVTDGVAVECRMAF